VEIFVLLFVVITLPLIIRTSRKFKLYAGGIVISTALLFLIGELIIKMQTDFFSLDRQEWHNQGYAEVMGKWVVPFFLLGAAIFMVLVNIRMIQQFLKRKDGIRWVWIAFVVVIDVFALFLVPMLLFFVAFMFFPFAP
jgi:hypothetical protein